MLRNGVDLKPVRGKMLPLWTMPEVAAADLLKQAVQKLKTFNKDMDDGPYRLLFPDGSEVVVVPGTEKPFLLAEYKKEIGKPYCRITLFVCPDEHFQEAYADPDSDSDSEVIVRTRRSLEFSEADTVLCEPLNESTPKHQIKQEVMETQKTEQIVISDSEDCPDPPKPAMLKYYSTYTCVYAPQTEEEEEEEEDDMPAPVPMDVGGKTMMDSDITLPDIIYDLSQSIDHGRVSRFNVCRSDVWDGALRGFKRSTFSEKCDLLVRFTDDAGVFEDSVDTAVREDEYFLAGKMIAVSVVHGGPGPHFLSEDFVHFLAGQPSFKATVNLITDEEIGQALREIESAASLEDLQDCTLKHSTMLQTAGCFRCVKSLEDKMTIVSDFLRWFIIDRNMCVIDRFKEGLSALGLYNALQLYPALLSPVLCHVEKQLTAELLEDLFRPDLSPLGSNRRVREGKTLGFWNDYLLDCQEGQTAVSVEEVLMFATGLNSLPPSGLNPQPKLEFIEDSPYPMANTCANTLKLPVLSNFELFKSNMAFRTLLVLAASKSNQGCISCTPIYLHQMIRSGTVNHVLLLSTFNVSTV
nr:G2/M phase-specific E3 ubiquitin-protein ligase-like isoform X2 [Misgurnus anguillicaudatus]